MRTPNINASLEKTLSRERLEKYFHDSGGDLDVALTIYERNTRLSEAFYAPLQSLEICFRNSLCFQMAQKYGEDWYKNGLPPLEADALQEIASAVAELEKGGGEASLGRIVAELRFSFWVGLIGPRYDTTLWRGALYKAFTARSGMPRKKVHGRFNALRRLRNRIAHHEPIFHRPVEQLHNETIEAISWMCRDTAAWAEHHSRFNAVYHGHTV